MVTTPPRPPFYSPWTHATPAWLTTHMRARRHSLPQTPACRQTQTRRAVVQRTPLLYAPGLNPSAAQGVARCAANPDTLRRPLRGERRCTPQTLEP